MKKELSAIELYHLMPELKQAEGQRIAKIFMPGKKDFVFRLKNTNLRVILPGFIYLAEATPKNPDQPPNLCMQLRKHLQGGIIRSIRQIETERVIEIEISTRSTTYMLFIEIFGKGNLILTQDDVIISALTYRRWSDRAILKGESYVAPRPDHSFLKISEKDMQDAPDTPLAKWLAIEFGLGGTYAQEVCLQGGQPQDIPAARSDSGRVVAAVNALVHAELSPRIVSKGDDVLDIVPFPLKLYAEEAQQEKESFSSAIDEAFGTRMLEQHEEQRLSGHGKKLQEIKKVLQQQQEQQTQLEQDREKFSQQGDFLYAHYQAIKDLLETVRSDPEGAKEHPQVASIDRKNKRVTVDVE